MNSSSKEKQFYIEIIDGVIAANSGSDLKVLADKVADYTFEDTMRYTLLMGLIWGALLQFNKEVAVEELNAIFKTI